MKLSATCEYCSRRSDLEDLLPVFSIDLAELSTKRSISRETQPNFLTFPHLEPFLVFHPASIFYWAVGSSLHVEKHTSRHNCIPHFFCAFCTWEDANNFTMDPCRTPRDTFDTASGTSYQRDNFLREGFFRCVSLATSMQERKSVWYHTNFFLSTLACIVFEAASISSEHVPFEFHW